MVLTRAFGEPDAAESVATFELAFQLGVRFIDTADSYGGGINETFVGRLIEGRREQVVLATKFGLVPSEHGGIMINGRPDYVRSACEASLRRLGVDHVDLYYQHRVDPDVPLVETVGAMGRLVQEGKVRHLGVCEVTADQLRAAHRTHPIAAVQSEWSLWARQFESEVLPAARELGIGIVPYSPLGRGFLAGAIRGEAAIGGDDLRRDDPRLHGDHLRHNLTLLDVLDRLAVERGGTPAQIALAWLMAQGNDVVPIPGVERRQLLEENVGAGRIKLSPDELRLLDTTFAPGVASGDPDATLVRGGGAVVGSGGARTRQP
jgi:aryl-alcohol dehydrogenase-like predicted oxidoreductase